ncbi:MAG TPA: DUF1631 family protein [Burkholderiaceae bacterium]|nr:DUF1631 family protein [Burkholderiaceae bacterium]
MPAPSPLLLRFVEDELARAPALGEQILQTVIDRSQAAGPARSARDRQLEHDVVRGLAQYRPAVVRRFAEALREQAQAELAKMGRTPHAAAKGAAAAPKLMLSLLDDDEVLADVELSRTIETIKNTAEYELRELRAFTAALVGEESVTGEADPLHAETYANALWAAARALPLSRDHHMAFMRLAAMPLAQSLRLAYAAACTRLESQGIEPSMYRTIVRATGSHVVRPGAREEPPAADLHDLLDSMPVPLDPPGSKSPPLEEVLLRADEMLRLLPDSASARTRAQALGAQRPGLLSSAASRVDQQMIELLSRLFDAILSDPRVRPAVQVLLSRLHGSVLRVALREPGTLDTYSHPVWLFMDRLAFQSEIHGGEHDPALAETLRHAQTLIDHIVREPVQDAALYHWAVQRLQAHEQERFDKSLQAAATKIEMLERFGSGGKPATASRQAQPALDVGSMDTVPADLLDSGESPPDAAAEWLRECPPGQWLQIFLQGHWRTAQLLWRSSGGDLWLLADAAGDNLTWAVREAAVEHLYGEQLLLPLAPRSLVQSAADKVLQDMIAPDDAV